MSNQDAADIAQMNSLSSEIPVAGAPQKKSKLLWIILGCVVVGVGLGIYVYQQSLTSSTSKSSPTPRATRTPVPSTTTVVPSPTAPSTNQVAPVPNTLTFPKKGKLRVFHTLNNIQMVLQLTINGSAKQIVLPAKSISSSNPANYADSSFEVEAGTSATLEAFLNTTSGPKLRGWMPPMDSNNKKECGVAGGQIANNEVEIAYIKTLLAGESIFDYQCWEDDDVPGEFNDLYMVWTYAPTVAAATTSPSPAASGVASASPVASKSPSPSPSPSASVKPSASVATTTTTTTSPSPRAAMPDTSEGVPVTGVFEITVGTVSIGILLLIVGLLGLLSL